MTESGFAESSAAEREALPPERKAWRVWPWLALAAVLAALLVVRGTRPSAEEPRGERHPAVGMKMPTFSLQPLTGEARQISLADLEGKVTLVNFWGPWCPACVVEFPHLMEIEAHFRERPGFQFLSVSTNYDALDESGLAESTEQFLKQYQVEIPTYRDPQALTTRGLVAVAKLEDFGYPATVLVGHEGAIRALWVGYVPGDEKAVREAVEAALKNLPNSGRKTP
jgi:thiol-disulfide isomerase/thioredoxin